MKRILFIFFASVLFVSCQKKQCWVCRVDMTRSGRADTTYVIPICDKTRKEIKAIEDKFGMDGSEYFLEGSRKDAHCD